MASELECNEIVSTPLDRNKSGIPREASARRRGLLEPRRPALWAVHEVYAPGPPLPQPVFGTFPKGFLEWALRLLRCSRDEVLHVCSGMLAVADGGVRVDIRPAAVPSVIADGRQLPFRDRVFQGVLIDPPYSIEYAQLLYGTNYPRPSHLLSEAARVVRPGGRIGFVHYLIPLPPPGTFILTIRGLSQGCNYRIRAFTVYEREPEWLLERA